MPDHVVYTLRLIVLRDAETDGYRVELCEHRTGSQGRLVTTCDVGPFGLEADVERFMVTALEEALSYGTIEAVALDTGRIL
jgi:hypothetical protein